MLPLPCSKGEILAMVRDAAGDDAIAVRIASATADARTRDRMRSAFSRGDFSSWRYDDERARCASDPSHVLEGARSIVCVAVAYATPQPTRAPLSGRVSSYAWSTDYHARMQALLREISARIDARAGARVTAIACDTKPLAERAFAARSGLGWIGKHTNLIAPSLGSCVFLGEIVTVLPLEPDAPLRKTCGGCRRCVDVCPTGALRGDYTIDATRCIADATQRVDGIPRALRALVGEWVWGCDICQDVCPPSLRAGKAASASFAPSSARASTPDLLWLLRLRSSDFRRVFKPTAMGWRGAAVLRRNAAVALGNALDRSTVPALIEALEVDPHPMVRGHVAWALGRIASPAADVGLRRRLASEDDASVRDEIECALRDIAGPQR